MKTVYMFAPRNKHYDLELEVIECDAAGIPIRGRVVNGAWYYHKRGEKEFACKDKEGLHVMTEWLALEWIYKDNI